MYWKFNALFHTLRGSNGQGQGSDYFNFNINNDGVGPAIVSSIKYIYKDTSFQHLNKLIHYFAELESNEKGKPVRLNFNYSNIMKGDVIAVSEKIQVFNANDSISVLIGKKYLSNTNLELEYCSVYNDCWLIKGDEVIELK